MVRSVRILRNTHAVSEYVVFDNNERPHQGLHNELVIPKLREIKAEGEVKVKSRLGGLINYYTNRLIYFLKLRVFDPS